MSNEVLENLLEACRDLIASVEECEWSIKGYPPQRHRQAMLRAMKAVEDATEFQNRKAGVLEHLQQLIEYVRPEVEGELCESDVVLKELLHIQKDLLTMEQTVRPDTKFNE